MAPPGKHAIAPGELSPETVRAPHVQPLGVSSLLFQCGSTVLGDHKRAVMPMQAYLPPSARLLTAARRHAPPLGRCWCVDEAYVGVSSRLIYLYRAVDEHGRSIEVLLREQ